MLYSFKLTNADEYVILDGDAYDYISSDPIWAKMDILNNLRKHASSGSAVFQKWYKNTLTQKPYLETVYLHKAIAARFLPKPSTDANFIVHLNGNKLDNRLENLKWVTRGELNRYSNYKSEHGYKGVRKEKNKYRAVLYIDKETVLHLGMFNTAEEAAEAYNQKAKEYFGEDGTRLNTIKKPVKVKKEIKLKAKNKA